MHATRVRLPLEALGLLTLLAAWPPGARADCPQSWLKVGTTRSYSVVPARDSSRTVCDVYGDCTSSRAAYDLVHGFALTEVMPGMAELGTDDEFRVIGPASITPIGFSARLTLSGYATAEADEFGYPGISSLSASFEDGVASASAGGDAVPGEPLGIAQTLELAQSRIPGAPFHLLVGLTASAMGLARGSLSAQLSFAGLPPGYAVVSCEGFVSDPTVATPASSWGRIKAIYRGR